MKFEIIDFVILAIIFIVFQLVFIKFRLDDIDRKLLMVVKAGGGLPKPSDAIVKMAKSGDKIKAIKAYRESTGLGLKDAKDVIEDLLRSHND